MKTLLTILPALLVAAPALAEDAPICFPLPSSHRVSLEVDGGSALGLVDAIACLGGLIPDRTPGVRDRAVTLRSPAPRRYAVALADVASVLSKSCLSVAKKGRRLVVKERTGRKCPAASDGRPVRTELPTGDHEARITTRPAPVPPRSVLAAPAAVRDMGDRRYRLSHDLRTLVLLDPMAFVGEGAAFPLPFAWPAAGFLVTWVRAGGVLDRMGLRTGDLVTTVNGLPIGSIDQAFFAYNALRDAQVVAVSVIRAGVPLAFVYEFEPGAP